MVLNITYKRTGTCVGGYAEMHDPTTHHFMWQQYLLVFCFVLICVLLVVL